MLDRWGRETLLVFFLTGALAKPMDYSDETMAAGGGARRAAPRRLPGSVRAGARGAWERFAAALEDDFNTPEALAVMHEWRDHELLRRALDVFGLASLAEERRGAGRGARARRGGGRTRARRATSREADRLRDEIEAAGWEVRDEADGYRLVPTR